MKLKISTSQLGGLSPEQWLRRAAYVRLVDRESGQESFARRLSRDFYPRFHLYVQVLPAEQAFFFNLHLDQKKASYAGQTRHSADYDGELVAAEADRLRAILGPLADMPTQMKKGSEKPLQAPARAFNGDVLRQLSPSSLPIYADKPKLSWWQKLFS
jgi:hypothetical protein